MAERQTCKQKSTIKLYKSHGNTYKAHQCPENDRLRVDLIEAEFESFVYRVSRLLRVQRKASVTNLSPHTTLRLYTPTWDSEPCADFMIALLFTALRGFMHWQV